MNDLEHELPGRLSALADELTPGTDLAGQAAAARGRYRRQRRTRAGLAAVAVAVVAIGIGVPTTLGALSSAPDTNRTADLRTPAPVTDSDPTTGPTVPVLPRPEDTAAAPTDPASSAAQADAAAQLEAGRARAELAEATGRLDSPVTLTAPARFGSCPDGVAALSRAFGPDVTSAGGHLPGGPDGCRWSLRGTAQGDQVTVGIGFLTGTTTAQMQAGVASPSGGRCTSAAAPAVHPEALLQRCAGEVLTDWYLNVPDSSGSGIWVINASEGVGSEDPTAGVALAAVAALATATWGG